MVVRRPVCFCILLVKACRIHRKVEDSQCFSHVQSAREWYTHRRLWPVFRCKYTAPKLASVVAVSSVICLVERSGNSLCVDIVSRPEFWRAWDLRYIPCREAKVDGSYGDEERWVWGARRYLGVYKNSPTVVVYASAESCGLSEDSNSVPPYVAYLSPSRACRKQYYFILLQVVRANRAPIDITATRRTSAVSLSLTCLQSSYSNILSQVMIDIAATVYDLSVLVPIPQRIGLAYEKWIGHVNPGEPGFVRRFP